MRPKYRLSHPDIGILDCFQILPILLSGQLVQDKTVKKMEHHLAVRLRIPFAVAVNSGTSALLLALKALNVGPGDHVIVPAFSFPATASAVELVGATCVFCDIRREDQNIDPERLEQLINPRIKAVIVVHEFGHPADMPTILSLTRRHGIPVIEDAACAVGSFLRGIPCGTFGTIGCFSFHPRKVLTSGEGGLVVMSNPALAERVAILRNHGLSPSSTRIDVLEPGYNFRITEFQAGLILAQLSRFDHMLNRRRSLAAIYDEEFSACDELETSRCLPESLLNQQTYFVLLNPKYDRFAVMQELRRNGVETSVGASSIPELSYYKNRYPEASAGCPEACYAGRHGLALPLNIRHLPKDIRRIAGIVKQTLSRIR